MAPKVPAAIIAAKAKLEALGLDITEENVKAHLSRADLNKAGGALRHALKNTESAEAYKLASNDKERHGFLVKFMLEPDVDKCFGVNKTARVTIQGEQCRRLWLTINQMAGPMFFNSLADATAIAKDCDSRPNRYPSMRALSVDGSKDEYHVEVSEEMYQKFTKDTAGVEGQAKMKPEQYKQVKDALVRPGSNAVPSSKPGKRQKLALEDLSPEDRKKVEAEQELKAANASLRDALAAAKRKSERVRADMASALEMATKLTAKGYPNQMKKFFDQSISPVKEKADAHLEFWAKVSRTDKDKMSCTELKDLTAQLDKASADMADMVKDVQPKLNDLRGLTR